MGSPPMTEAPPDVVGGWPFWAPAEEAMVEAALDLAEVVPGDRFVDLGCGDGTVLLAAARRGARVAGIEIDPELADEAGAHLADAGVDAEIVVADLRAGPLPVAADVVFTYLSPATLQQLGPALAALPPGTRLVTTGYAFPGWEPSAAHDLERCWRYDLPAAPVSLAEPGWPASAVLALAVADHTSLLTFTLTAPGGPLSVAAAGALAGAVDIEVGVVDADAGATVAVDLRFHPRAAATALDGQLVAFGLAGLAVSAVWSATESGLWRLDPRGQRRLRRLVHDGTADLDAVHRLAARLPLAE